MWAATQDPHGLRFSVDLESNLDLVSKFSPLSHHQIACHISNLPKCQYN
jgi:hypothetical protein